MEHALGNVGLVDAFGTVVCIRVESTIRRDMVQEKCLEVLETAPAEQEAVDPGTKLLEGKVGWSEQSSSSVGRSIIDSWE